MQVKDLKSPITAIKLDWVAATSWMGFTPRSDGTKDRNQCTSTVLRQYGKGYVVEYITVSLQKPNAGFENHPVYLQEKAEHKDKAGRFVAIHQLKTSSRPLPQILGTEEYDRLQDVWAQGGRRIRWSVAFPIIGSYRIKGKPVAKELLGEELYAEYITQTAFLREIDDRVRGCLSELEIEKVEAKNEWIAIEDEIAAATHSPIDTYIQSMIDRDLNGALEGQTEERKQKLRQRAAWLAVRFIKARIDAVTLRCDDCCFDPYSIMAGVIKPRALLDVHHKHPLYEGIRRTNFDDFALLCPTCHRIEHQRLKLGVACKEKN
jgi:5-methylcytosine-specific restriction protein A